MTLAQVERGQSYRIVNFLDERIRAQAIRFGIGEGERVFCEQIIAAGLIILRKNHQQIVLGRKIAQHIVVE